MPDDAKSLTYSIQDAARALGVSERTIHRRIVDGTIASRRFGGRRLIPRSEVARVLGVARDEVEEAHHA